MADVLKKNDVDFCLLQQFKNKINPSFKTQFLESHRNIPKCPERSSKIIPWDFKKKTYDVDSKILTFLWYHNQNHEIQNFMECMKEIGSLPNIDPQDFDSTYIFYIVSSAMINLFIFLNKLLLD